MNEHTCTSMLQAILLAAVVSMCTKKVEDDSTDNGTSDVDKRGYDTSLEKSPVAPFRPDSGRLQNLI